MFGNITLLLISTMIWGFGFIATRWTFETLDPFWAHALRFLLAGFLGFPFLIYRKSFWKNPKILKKSMISSFFLMCTLLFQTIGLSTTTVAKSGFITTLYALFVPLFMMILTKKKYKATFWALIMLAFMGMALMCNLKITGLNYGDFLTLLCAVFGAIHIIYIGFIAKEIDSPVEFNFLQNFFVGILSCLIAFFVKGPIHVTATQNVVLGLLFSSIFSSMIAFSIQVIAQKKIPTHIAGLIFLMESPFAAIFGYFIFKEVLSPLNILGAFLIMIAIMLIPVLGREVTAVIKEK